MSNAPGKFPKPFSIYRGCDFKVTLELKDQDTKEAIDYSGSTFSAILIDQQDSDYTILATFAETAETSLSAGLYEITLSATVTACLTNDQAYFRMYEHVNGERFLYAINNNVRIKD